MSLSLRDYAVRYAEIGLPVLALAPRTKVPPKDSDGLHDATTNAEAIGLMWEHAPTRNIGVAVPDDVVVVDVDSDEALQALKYQDVDLPATVETKTPRGYHFWYRCEVGEFRPKVGIFPGVDIRAAGSYVVVPPSIHPDGDTYRWTTPPKPGNFTPRPDWLAEVASKDATEHDGEKVDSDAVLSGVSEGARDITLFRYACKLRAQKRTRQEAEVLVCHAAEKCSPVFDRRAALAKVESAWKYDPGESDEKANGAGKVWTASEFMAADFPPPRWLVDQILPEGLTLVVSPSKVGKSFLMGAVAYAVSVGGTVLGYMKANQSDVAYLDLEQSEGRAQIRWDQIFGGPPPAGFHLCFEWPRLGHGCIERMDELCQREPSVGMVVVDVLSLIWPTVEKRGGNAYHREYETLTELKQLARRWGIALVLIHHTNRGTHDDPLYSVSGTNAMTGVPDAVWMLTRERGRTIGSIYITGRSVPEFKQSLTWDPQLCSWRLENPMSQARVVR